MQIDFVSRHVEIDDSLKVLVQDKLEKATRYLLAPIELRVAFESSGGDKRLFAAEINVAHRGGNLHARAEGPDLRDATNEALSGIATQARRSRRKRVLGGRRIKREAAEQRHWPVDVLARESLRSGSTPRIVKSSQIDIDPMTIDEAALLLESSRHDFVVFLDSESARVSVLYKRKDEDLGLIAPEF